MISLLKKIFFRYQQFLWYAGQAKSEYGKIGSWVPETLMIMTYLTVKGVEIKPWYIPIAYLSLLVIAALVGKILATIGVVKYVTKLGNEHNEDLQKIIKLLEK